MTSDELLPGHRDTLVRRIWKDGSYNLMRLPAAVENLLENGILYPRPSRRALQRRLLRFQETRTPLATFRLA